MKTTDYGKYFLKHDDITVELKEECLIGFNGKTANVLNCERSIAHFDEVLIFRLLDNSVEFASFSTGKLYSSVSDGKTIRVLDVDWKFYYSCSDENVEKIIKAFKRNEITGEMDIQHIFIRYAKMKNITEKQAVSYLVTTIDVPEIDKV